MRSQVICSITFICLGIFTNACTNTQNKNNALYDTGVQYVCCTDKGWNNNSLYCPGNDCQACTTHLNGNYSDKCSSDVLEPNNWFNQETPFGSNCAQQNDGSYSCYSSVCSDPSGCQKTCYAGCTPETTKAKADVTVQSSNGVAYCSEEQVLFCPSFTVSSDLSKASNCECLPQE